MYSFYFYAFSITNLEHFVSDALKENDHGVCTSKNNDQIDAPYDADIEIFYVDVDEEYGDDDVNELNSKLHY